MNPTAFATAFRHWGDTREGLHLDGVLIALPLRTERRQQRSEEHTSELQSQSNLVCRLLLEKKKNNDTHRDVPGSGNNPMISFPCNRDGCATAWLCITSVSCCSPLSTACLVLIQRQQASAHT